MKRYTQVTYALFYFIGIYRISHKICTRVDSALFWCYWIYNEVLGRTYEIIHIHQEYVTTMIDIISHDCPGANDATLKDTEKWARGWGWVVRGGWWVGGWWGYLGIKMSFRQYKDSHIKDKSVLSSTWKSPYTERWCLLLRGKYQGRNLSNRIRYLRV